MRKTGVDYLEVNPISESIWEKLLRKKEVLRSAIYFYFISLLKIAATYALVIFGRLVLKKSNLLSEHPDVDEMLRITLKKRGRMHLGWLILSLMESLQGRYDLGTYCLSLIIASIIKAERKGLLVVEKQKEKLIIIDFGYSGSESIVSFNQPTIILLND